MMDETYKIVRRLYALEEDNNELRAEIGNLMVMIELYEELYDVVFKHNCKDYGRDFYHEDAECKLCRVLHLIMLEKHG